MPLPTSAPVAFLSDYLPGQDQDLSFAANTYSSDFGTPAASYPLPTNAMTVLQCPYTASNCPILAPYAFDASAGPGLSVSVEAPNDASSSSNATTSCKSHVATQGCPGVHNSTGPSPASTSECAPRPNSPVTAKVGFGPYGYPSLSYPSTGPYDRNPEEFLDPTGPYDTPKPTIQSQQQQEPSKGDSLPNPPDLEDIVGHGDDIVGEDCSCTAFISKLYHLCSHEEYRDYIRWNTAGDAFVLAHANSHFATTILPRFFRHSNVSSFIRQLNLYNFVRLPTIQLLDTVDSNATASPTSAFSGFSHPHFRRGNEASLRLIKPKPSKTKAARKAAAATAQAGGKGRAGNVGSGRKGSSSKGEDLKRACI